MRVLVVGAGVVGLCCAVRLGEAGHEVHVVARDLPLETTSSVAAALWYPYRALPEEQATRWAAQTYDWLTGLAAAEPAAGVTLRWGRELLRSRSEDPWWRSGVPTFDRLRPEELPRGYADGWRFPAPVADTSRFLPWLAARAVAAGATLTRAWLPALPTHAGVVVNAAGLSARALAHDPSVTPVRGQVLRMEQVGIAEWTLDQADPARPVYVVPRADDVVVGGTAEEGSWELAVDPATTREVLARATALVPQLAAARLLGVRVGLRPARPAVRLETEHLDAEHPHAERETAGREARPGRGAAVVHCYGHGGAGVTLAWGCAGDVVAEVARLALA